MMAPQKYQLLGSDSEKGESTFSAPPSHSGSSTVRASTSPGTVSIFLAVISSFLSGIMFTLVIMTIKSSYNGMGQYETGFREEKLCESA